MPVKLKDMSFVRHAQSLSSFNAGLRQLVQNVIDETNTSNISWAGGVGNASKSKFFNHLYNRDPATNGGTLSINVTVHIYYQPATSREYDDYDVIDKSVGMLSGRRRLAVRIENDEYSFYTTNHPNQRPGLRTNEYGVFTPIDTTK